MRFVYTGVDLHVVEQVPIVAPPQSLRTGYMTTKKEKMGHLLPDHVVQTATIHIADVE